MIEIEKQFELRAANKLMFVHMLSVPGCVPVCDGENAHINGGVNLFTLARTGLVCT